jgi:hypothetical protein
MKTVNLFIKTITLLAIVLGGCTNNSETTQETDLLKLKDLKDEIEQLVAAGICTEKTDCDYIAFGSKPCGGAWSYLVYSSSIDIELLKEKVATYNENEATFNIKWGTISDCMAVLPPTSVECINGECTAVY